VSVEAQESDVLDKALWMTEVERDISRPRAFKLS